MATRMLLDTSSLLYRAFFGVPKDIKAASGEPINAIRGYLDMLATLTADHRPDEVVSVLDADWRPQFRVDLYAGYKAERNDEPEELTPQFALLPQVLDAAGLPHAEADGFEAEDVIATLIARRPPGERVLIVTGDRDLLCVVEDPEVKVLFPVKGVKELKEFDEAAVIEKYGITPAQYCEFAMMRGDPSDGLPGVAGIGPTRAARLIAEHGSIEEILRHLGTLPPKQRESFEGARDYLAKVAEIVPPRRDVEVRLTSSPGDHNRLLAMAAELNFEGPAKRLLEALSAA